MLWLIGMSLMIFAGILFAGLSALSAAWIAK
jgi:hypothetical protein